MSITKIAGRALSVLVPTVEANAGCGRCNAVVTSTCCAARNKRKRMFVDDCGVVCAPHDCITDKAC